MQALRMTLLLAMIMFSFNIFGQSKAKSGNTKTTSHSSTPAASPQIKMDRFEQKQGVHMTFDNEHLNLGKVKKGEVKKFNYVFTNTGTEPIEIDIVSGCDCTTIDYPKEKIMPGKKGTLYVTFESAKKDESETVDIDIYLKNINPKNGHRIFKIVDYKFELLK